MTTSTTTLLCMMIKWRTLYDVVDDDVFGIIYDRPPVQFIDCDAPKGFIKRKTKIKGGEISMSSLREIRLMAPSAGRRNEKPIGHPFGVSHNVSS